MTSRDFCYWLQGFFEVSRAETMTPAQVDVVKNHLSMVFKYEIDPSMGGPVVQASLGELHCGPTKTDQIVRC